MNLVFVAAIIAACSAAKLDRTYLPPSAETAGGSHETLQTPLTKSSHVNLPSGSYANEFQGIVVDAALADTRASSPVQTGLGGPRISYGSTDSKVGAAAFRDTATLIQSSAAEIKESTGVFPIAGLRQPEYPETDKPERIQAAKDRTSNILRYQNNGGLDNFNYGFETDNGILAEVKGVAINGVKTQGGYSYTGDDGQIYSVTYTADEGGYRPKGAHIPTPPPIPIEILEALQRNAKDEAAGIIDDGSYDAEKYKTSSEENTNNDNYRYQHRQSNYNQPRPHLVESDEYYNENSHNFRRPTFVGYSSNVNMDIKSQPTLDSSTNMGANNQFEASFDKVSPNEQYNQNLNNKQFGSEIANVLSQRQESENQLYHHVNSSPNDKIASVSTSDSFGKKTLPLSQQKLQDLAENSKGISFVRPSSYDIPISGYFPNFPSQPNPSINNNPGEEPFKSLSDQLTASPSKNKQPGLLSSIPTTTNVKLPFEMVNIPFSSFIKPSSTSYSIGPQQLMGSEVPTSIDKIQGSQPSRNQADLSTSGISSLQQSYPTNQLQYNTSPKLNDQINNSQHISTYFDATKPEQPIVDKEYKSSTPIEAGPKPINQLNNQHSQITGSGKPYFYDIPSKSYGEQLQDKVTDLSSVNLNQQNSHLASFSENQRFTGTNNFPKQTPSLLLTTPKKDMFIVSNEASLSGLTQASISSFPLLTQTATSYSQQPLNQFGSATSLQFGQFHSPTFSQLGTNSFQDKKNIRQPPLQGQSSLADEVPEIQKTNAQSPEPSNLSDIYEYKKPTQHFPSSSPGQATLSQTNTQNYIGTQFSQRNTDMNAETPLNQTPNSLQSQNQFSQQNFNKESNNQSPVDQKQKTPLSQVTFSRPQPLGSRPQSSLFGCCSNSKPKTPETPIAGVSHNDQNLANTSDRDHNKFIANIPNLPSSFSQQGGQSLTGKGEEFNTVHKQPSFDDSGYHY